MKISEKIKYTFTNKLNKKNSGQSKKKTRSKRKWLPLAILLLFVLFFIINAINVTVSNNVKYYDSIEELIEDNFKNKNTMYVTKSDFTYVFSDLDTNVYETLVHKNEDDKYLLCYKNRGNVSDYTTIFETVGLNGFAAYLKVTVYEGNAIILINRYHMDWDGRKVNIKDSYEELQPIDAFCNVCYFKVMDSELLDENYEIIVEMYNRDHVIFKYGE